MYIPSKNQYIYKRGFNKARCMCFSIKDETFLENYNEVWGKVSNII